MQALAWNRRTCLSMRMASRNDGGPLVVKRENPKADRHFLPEYDYLNREVFVVMPDKAEQLEDSKAR